MNHYQEYIGKQLHQLTAIPSPSGYTKKISSYVFETLSEMGYAPTYTRKGNVHCEIGGYGNPLVLVAHIDTIGAMVRSIKENGRLRPIRLGGHRWGTADGENCYVMTRSGRTFTGVILNTAPSAHVFPDSVEITEKNMEILLDENVSSKEQVKALGIDNGDYISLDPRTVITESGYIKSRYLDDKLCVAIVLALAKWVKDEHIYLNRKVTLMFSTYEEVGLGGNYIPADTEDVIALDMGCIGDDLECTEKMVSICAKDALGPYNYDMITELTAICKKYNLDYAIDVYPNYSSDVETAVRAGYDIRHALLGPGIYASHNYERSHLDAVDNTFILLQKYISE